MEFLDEEILKLAKGEIQSNKIDTSSSSDEENHLTPSQVKSNQARQSQFNSYKTLAISKNWATNDNYFPINLTQLNSYVDYHIERKTKPQTLKAYLSVLSQYHYSKGVDFKNIEKDPSIQTKIQSISKKKENIDEKDSARENSSEPTIKNNSRKKRSSVKSNRHILKDEKLSPSVSNKKRKLVDIDSLSDESDSVGKTKNSNGKVTVNIRQKTKVKEDSDEKKKQNDFFSDSNSDLSELDEDEIEEKITSDRGSLRGIKKVNYAPPPLDPFKDKNLF
ncbi:hypothetical protein HK099_001088 [Clydaea vesicula]|uniref:Uncharacterized protein n=1 Tax=Clydaea vesicula TaxID=447962 RepID=A0AAD5XX55_9FUNG|nr:hypothetical protein HK099_001088 [Clydaea vesicula]KAJ3384814.1 hypothetical protein HDU92_003413 [Lobulomyces angularis]